MNYCVPDFEIDEDYSIPTSSVLTPKKSPLPEEEIMELLWQNGQVVMQSQNQRSVKRSHVGDAAIPTERREIRSLQEESTTDHLFMQEDEMTSWLHYPMDYSSFDRGDLYSDLIYPAPGATVAPSPRTAQAKDVLISPPTEAYSLPPIPRPRSSDAEYSERIQNFAHFSRPKARMEPGTSSSNKEEREPTVVNSCETPVEAAPESMTSHVGITVQVSGANTGCGTDAEGGGRETETCDMTSSPVRSRAGASPSVEPVHKTLLPTEDRKRKGREADDSESPSEDAEFESPDAKKQIHGSPSAKKTRAAEVHNLSERRRRDRINEKMKALQELIPHCNKSDKASMLDEAIEYLKSLQLQVQMMSMGCSMMPVVFPGFQQYMPPVGMAMGMEMGMSRPMMSFPSVLVGPAMPTPGAAAHMGPRFPVPAFHMPSFPLPTPTNQSPIVLNSPGTENPYKPRMMNFPGPYQQFIGLHHAQVPLPQNQATMQPCSSREVEKNENLQSG